ncbi:MAG: agmatinase [Candidatus Zixiibacteriota bacterium]|nr:MAG: agmatinase [candidate division Zixibacteria bacterium]
MTQISSHPHTFLGLSSELAKYERSEFVVLPVPYEQTTTYQVGTKHAPDAIIAASQEVETFDEELKLEACQAGICTLIPLEMTAAGPQGMLESIGEVIGKLLNDGKKVVMIGGEHTISIGAVKAFREKYPNLCVLQLDAHADLRDTYQENKYSHACVMRRIGEICPFVGVGVRNVSREEHEFIQQNKTDIFFDRDLTNLDQRNEAVLERLGPDVYLTLDMDFLDPSIMPSVGTPEPGGFLWYETLDFLREVVSRKNVVGFDLVELCPIPGLVAPDFLAAKLIYRIIGYMVAKKGEVDGEAVSKLKKQSSK